MAQKIVSPDDRPLRILLSYVMDAPNAPQAYSDELHAQAQRAGRATAHAGDDVQPWFLDALRPGCNAYDAVKECDAVVVLGGADVHPWLYGLDEAHWDEVDLDGVNITADEHEIALIRATLDARKPLLCICRGMQLANVALGGTLIPDLKTPSIHNSRPGGDGWASHTVSIHEDTLVAAIYGPGEVGIRSAHHQAVDRLGKELKPTATAPDDLVEAIELPNHAWFLGVQWHPEEAFGDPEHLRAITGHLVTAARELRDQAETASSA